VGRRGEASGCVDGLVGEVGGCKAGTAATALSNTNTPSDFDSASEFEYASDVNANMNLTSIGSQRLAGWQVSEWAGAWKCVREERGVVSGCEAARAAAVAALSHAQIRSVLNRVAAHFGSCSAW
jgi:hypothetical protein